jgi:hypothetical protein
MFSNTSRVMVYSPLLVVQCSLVELAEAEVILQEEREEEVDDPRRILCCLP